MLAYYREHESEKRQVFTKLRDFFTVRAKLSREEQQEGKRQKAIDFLQYWQRRKLERQATEQEELQAREQLRKMTLCKLWILLITLYKMQGKQWVILRTLFGSKKARECRDIVCDEERRVEVLNDIISEQELRNRSIDEPISVVEEDRKRRSLTLKRRHIKCTACSGKSDPVSNNTEVIINSLISLTNHLSRASADQNLARVPDSNPAPDRQRVTDQAILDGEVKAAVLPRALRRNAVLAQIEEYHWLRSAPADAPAATGRLRPVARPESGHE